MDKTIYENKEKGLSVTEWYWFKDECSGNGEIILETLGGIFYFSWSVDFEFGDGISFSSSYYHFPISCVDLGVIVEVRNALIKYYGLEEK